MYTLHYSVYSYTEVASFPGQIFCKEWKGEKCGLVSTYSAHTLSYAVKYGESPSFLLSTMLCFYCVDQEGLHTSLKPEEALVYLKTVVWSGCLSLEGRAIASLCASCGTSNCLEKTTRQYDHRRILRLQTKCTGQLSWPTQ